jgi:hypothetical protein
VFFINEGIGVRTRQKENQEQLPIIFEGGRLQSKLVYGFLKAAGSTPEVTHTICKMYLCQTQKVGNHDYLSKSDNKASRELSSRCFLGGQRRGARRLDPAVMIPKLTVKGGWEKV